MPTSIVGTEAQWAAAAAAGWTICTDDRPAMEITRYWGQRGAERVGRPTTGEIVAAIAQGAAS